MHHSPLSNLLPRAILRTMRKRVTHGVLKTWLYPVASFLLGAWIAPLPYNAGKALAEVTAKKETNGLLDWLGDLCARSEFPAFYTASVVFAALVLFLPWMEWLYAGNPARSVAPNVGIGQPLKCRSCRWLLLIAGFFAALGILFVLGLALNPSSFRERLLAGGILHPATWKSIVTILFCATVVEIMFRGVFLGIFLRKLRHVTAILMAALLFALVFSLIPPSTMAVADSEAPGIGFAMLRRTLEALSTWRGLWLTFIPLFLLGTMLGYARWRTASLWLPIGLHAGWLCGKSLLSGMISITLPLDAVLRDGVVPAFAAVFATSLAYFTHKRRDDGPDEPTATA